MPDMTGKTVMITGASRGIGEAVAHVFAAAGANVVLLARDGDSLARIAGDIGEKAIAMPCDISRYWEIEAAVDRVAETFGPLDVLIGNAGVLKPITSLATADPEAWGQVIDVNIKGVFNGMRAALPYMLAQGAGTILTVSSGAAHAPLEGWSAYCTSKAGAAMLTRAAHLENADKGLRIMGLSPGTVATQMQRDIKASGINPVSALEWEDHIPADWPARALLWMCDPASDAYLGQEISLRDDDIRRKVGLIQ